MIRGFFKDFEMERLIKKSCFGSSERPGVILGLSELLGAVWGGLWLFGMFWGVLKRWNSRVLWGALGCFGVF